MTKLRTLNGLAHDTLDHAEGPLAWLHPHIWEYAAASKLKDVAIDPLSAPAISTPAVPEPLRLASSALQDWFHEHLETYGFHAEDLAAAVLRFGAFGSHPYAFGTTATITSRNGRVFSYRRGWPPN
jgi:hypothetical protein